MANMRDMVRNNTKQKKEYEKPSEWGRCKARGCPMMSTVKPDEVCSYHHGVNFGQSGEGWNAMTEAIKHNKGLIQKHTQLVHTPSSDWNIMAMRGWDVLPMGDKEPATMYVNRFYLWIHQQVKESAAEFER